MYPSFRDEEDAGKKRKEHTRLHEKKKLHERDFIYGSTTVE